jgi:hypothetical protein
MSDKDISFDLCPVFQECKYSIKQGLGELAVPHVGAHILSPYFLLAL